MKTCPFCKKEVEELRGDCPHCSENLDAEGIREHLLAQKTDLKGFHDSIEEMRKQGEDSEARLKVIEDKMLERAEYLSAIANGEEKKPKPANIGNIIRALMTRDWKHAEYEKEIIDKHSEEMRALSTQTTGTGGAIVPEEYLPQEMVDLLRAKLITEALGARVLSGLTGSPVLIPKLAGGATAYHVAENYAKTPSDQSFEEISMTPHEIAAATIYSKRMALLSNPSVDQMIQEDLLAVLALGMDYQALYGDGAGNRPVGIINTPGIGTYTLINDAGAGATPVPEDIDGIELVILNSNADMGALGWAMAPRSRQTFKGMRDDSGGAGTGQYLFRDDIKAGNLDGYLLRHTTQIPINLTKGASADCSNIVFANWNDLVIAYWGGLELATSDQAGDTFVKNQIIIKAAWLYDIAVRHEESFVVVDGVRP